MAGFLNILSKLFGNKYDKDVKKITPIVKEINLEYEKLNILTNDELRNKTTNLKQHINSFVASEKKEVQDLKKTANSTDTTADEKESLYKKIDSLEKTILEKIEDSLNTILPIAFAIVKET